LAKSREKVQVKQEFEVFFDRRSQWWSETSPFELATATQAEPLQASDRYGDEADGNSWSERPGRASGSIYHRSIAGGWGSSNGDPQR
jgi:hypothetical protein